ncbi:twin-arginine translocation signal domain-containing protein [Verminephrobacter aporrectodeae subsp. tuberculatae]|uniref:Twin-arginine translocation signal domain-containing protein n=1 Tax=Verminephrobacter aporrectodeae subsp. tuberculatae TaxID=1110392 RepID=A0ABT3KRS6_9BURK|nr:twin-arginine translocation signal domain-containing protein [Verminephrobacter aporrectodeae]MCW5256002.1 twin-arginine translocation signal domain-containing protein [Verminephrobacter aporrectodeae subsp. tuberculatae]MCW5321016.1 twin-arginine translocation signal domain-containing protein [Verminephrobacter aporrectodeae subsp. tuberculatae]MCW8206819.1 twin-arginine translocation signal domain-containing protein [Verminephrobacter aporrectodeae subsp. tuberculatae]
MQNRQPPDHHPSPARRSFLRGAATAGAAAAAVVALPHAVPAPDATPPEPARGAPEGGGGYHLSAHVRQYYETTRV